MGQLEDVRQGQVGQVGLVRASILANQVAAEDASVQERGEEVGVGQHDALGLAG